MTTITGQAEVTREHVLQVEVPCELPAGPVNVTILVEPTSPASSDHDWRRIVGLGSEVWRGMDSREYLADMRSDRDRETGV
ncbi:MAG: hypothetical protein K2X38_11170 [Gemmataceae bacterium]|nr:hypothetical protein [Gemmataceae bacterium]